MIRRGHALVERPVDGGAELLHAPGFVAGDLKASQAAYGVVVLNQRAAHDGPHAIDVDGSNKKGAFSVEVVNFASLGPIGRVNRRPFQAFPDTGDAGHDQPDLRAETASRLILPLGASRHRRVPQPGQVRLGGLCWTGAGGGDHGRHGLGVLPGPAPSV